MGSERVTGIGGAFFRARDPDGLARWYAEHLGINPMSSESEEVWWQEAGPTVWAPFPADTDYFGRRDQSWMINFRVATSTPCWLSCARPASTSTTTSRSWRASAASAGRRIRRATGSSCGSRRPRRCERP